MAKKRSPMEISGATDDEEGREGEGESVGGVFVAGVQPPDAAVMRSSSEKKCIFLVRALGGIGMPARS
jgi:hypothetical protein